jgi:putative FmdB family regulatory protein
MSRVIHVGGDAMPLYEYECRTCKKVFTVALTLREHEQGKVTCPGCGSEQVAQLITSFIAKTVSKA